MAADGDQDRPGLAVLITNSTLDWPSGTVVYVRDLALELVRRGHRPTVYTWIDGAVGRELRDAGVPVVRDLWSLRERPDVIHGHHRALIRGALLRFPDVPAIAFCHDHTSAWDSAPVDDRVRRYFGVSGLCVDRLLADGAPPGRTLLLPNFVDARRLPIRTGLPDTPRRALLFSNYATPDTHLPAVAEACRRLGIDLDVVGRGVGRLEAHPERILADYDLVFAKAKAAMEAMAVGCAVVLCDFGGVGPMVTSEEFDRLRPLNFGFAALTLPLTPENVERQILAYDATDAALVGDRVRAGCGIDSAVSGLIEIYRDVICEAIERPSSLRRAGRLETLRYRTTSTVLSRYYRTFGMDSRRVPGPLRPLYAVCRSLVRRLLWAR